MDPSRSNLKYPDRQSLPGSAQRNVPLLVKTILPLLLREWDGQDEGEVEASPEKNLPSQGEIVKQPRRALEIAAGHGDLTLALSKAVREADEVDRSTNDVNLPRVDSKMWHWICTEGDEALLPLIREKLTKEAEDERDEIKIARLDIDDESDWMELLSSSSFSSSSQSTSSSSLPPSPSPGPFDLILISNLLHIVPFSTVQRLFTHLPLLLNLRNPHASVCVYGAFNEEGLFTSEGNRNFDTDLRARNPSYGLRDLQGEIVPLAQRNGLRLERVIRLERGNLLLLFQSSK